MSSELIGKTLGNFEITGVIGRGGMATVYRARQKTMQRDVAIKVMKHDLAENDEFVTRFEREARILADLQHPHILPVIDFGHTEESVYIVSLFAEGGSLDGYIRRQSTLNLETVEKILTQICSALQFAHEKGIIHRDIKSSNILLDKRDNAYLTDFGIAKLLESDIRLTTSSHTLGTPAYMAPEQWRGEPANARSDIYSLGIVTYEMLSGDLPYAADTPFSMMYKHVSELPPSLSALKGIPIPIEIVVLRALAKDSEARFQKAEDFAKAFTAAVRNDIQMLNEVIIDVGDAQIGKDGLTLKLPTTKEVQQVVSTELPTASTIITQRRIDLFAWAGVLSLIIVIALGLFLFINRDDENAESGQENPTATLAPLLNNPPPLGGLLPADFPELGMEFNHPDNWQTEVTAENVVIIGVFPPGSPVQSGTIELHRGSLADLTDSLGIEFESGMTFDEKVAVAATTLFESESVQIANVTRFQYPTLILTANTPMGHQFLVFVEYGQEDYLVIWADLAIRDEVRNVADRVLMPIVTSLRIDGNPLIARTP